MGASGWQYTVPYDSDLQAALDRLRAETFSRGDYLWPWEGDWLDPSEQRPRPTSIEELVTDEEVAQEGTHSIIDCPRVVEALPADDAAWSSATYQGTIVPVTGAELLAAVGTDHPGRDQLDVLDEVVPCARWVGRAAVLYSSSGEPEQLAFWGYSGD
ncbi:hypothetical protein [Nocardioides sp. 503]|uniref:hypothetical protein n=1 Tax=Nocardioides sp. 503 TaxID=2508326 RepID=UPI00106F4C20|nr:hypothetical protein [Nocardioides sp. 503]